VREFDGANANGQPIRLTLLSSAPRRAPAAADRGSLFDRIEKPSRSMFERIDSSEDVPRRRGGGAATARHAGVCVCPRVWTVTSLEDATRDRPCRVAVVEEESAAAVGLARGRRRMDAMVAEARRRVADQALGPRRPRRSSMLRWKTTSVATAARLLRTTTVPLNSRMAVERRLQPLRLRLLLVTTTST
jgi:hypothetical protein